MTLGSHKHKCMLCGKKFRCMTNYSHGGEENKEVYDCQGDYDSFCDKCPIEEQAKKLIELGKMDDLPLTPENYGEINYRVLREILPHGYTWL